MLQYGGNVPQSSTCGFRWEEKNPGTDLSISEVPTSKDKIEQPDLAADENMYIPPRGSSVIICGKSGSGKSTLLARLITDGRFYGKSPERPKGWFDKIFIFSPTADGDDVQRALGIEKKYVFTDLEEAAELLEVILDTQKSKLEGGDRAHKVEQYAIIFEDIIGDRQFMNEPAFTKCFYMVRHTNCTTFLCTQHFTRVPRVCRLQANFVFFFQGSASEVETITEEFAPPQYTKKEFAVLVTEATKAKYSFLTINMKTGWDKRFRRGLGEFVLLDRLVDPEEQQQEQDDDTSCSDEDEGDQDKYDEDMEFNQELDTVIDVHSKCQQHGANEQTTGGSFEAETARGRFGRGHY